MTEQEYKEYIYDKAKKVKIKKELDELLNEVVNNENLDYGTIVYAICGCMKATLNYINNSQVGGITGFQAGFIGWEMIKEYTILGNELGMRIINYDDLLYPQYEYSFEKAISKDLWLEIQKQAKKLIKENRNAHPKVIEHWKSIIDGQVPFGFVVKGDVKK